MFYIDSGMASFPMAEGATMKLLWQEYESCCICLKMNFDSRYLGLEDSANYKLLGLGNRPQDPELSGNPSCHYLDEVGVR